ncbi:uncharacterized protein EKO05_0009344 [Ascochyta rabiei]|uniref:uncharacterized protein n=1 Tax=Didymella rabiei TaxID=5454 RepID=UPI0021FE2CC1|nr:uncharacterized protein EKO05_0009344 [Ascochyta rabiei]UPX19068.1 hypothetical protein EKO05_0009344 [Ascochyta rabiei]
MRSKRPETWVETFASMWTVSSVMWSMRGSALYDISTDKVTVIASARLASHRALLLSERERGGFAKVAEEAMENDAEALSGLLSRIGSYGCPGPFRLSQVRLICK